MTTFFLILRFLVLLFICVFPPSHVSINKRRTLQTNRFLSGYFKVFEQRSCAFRYRLLQNYFNKGFFEISQNPQMTWYKYTFNNLHHHRPELKVNALDFGTRHLRYYSLKYEYLVCQDICVFCATKKIMLSLNLLLPLTISCLLGTSHDSNQPAVHYFFLPENSPVF